MLLIYVLLHLLLYGIICRLLAPSVGPWAILLCGVLIWISVTDFLYFIIPDSASLLLFASGMILVGLAPEYQKLELVLGGIVWPVVFFIVAWAFRRLRGFDGLGFGDVKLMAGLGLWCGLIGGIWVVLMASLAGAGTLIILRFINPQRSIDLSQTAVAFGPFLCLSGWCVWLMGAAQ